MEKIEKTAEKFNQTGQTDLNYNDEDNEVIDSIIIIFNFYWPTNQFIFLIITIYNFYLFIN